MVIHPRITPKRTKLQTPDKHFKMLSLEQPDCGSFAVAFVVGLIPEN